MMTGDTASDLSDSAGTSWLDVAGRRWTGAILAACGLTEAQMPRLFEGSEITGHLHAAIAAALGICGSIDANRGNAQNGWDADQFPNSAEEMAPAMLPVLRAGGFTTGGFNFDAKVRRQSIDAVDLFHGHIGGIDTVARGLLAAAAIVEDGRIDRIRAEHYTDWDTAFGRSVADADLAAIADLAIARDIDPHPRSGQRERIENIINRFV